MPTDAELRGYLLGETGDDAAAGIERAYLAHDVALEAVATAERDLIDDYLDDRLAAPTRARFETHYLASPLHRQRLAIARALRGRQAAVAHGPHAAIPRESRVAFPGGRAWLPWALAAAFAVAVLGVVWRLQGPMPGAPVVIAVNLPAVVVRGEGGTPTVTVPDETALIDLRLEGGAVGSCAEMTVVVRTVEGRETWRGPATEDGATGGGATGGTAGTSPIIAVARVPARQLPDGDYVVLLICGAADETPLQRSSFRVVRR